MTDPMEWTCSSAFSDKSLEQLLCGMMRKVPTSRYCLEDVKANSWVASAGGLRHVSFLGGWERIEVNEDDLRRAVISGHVDNFRRTKKGTLYKLTDATEGRMYNLLHRSACSPFLPQLINISASTGKRVILELQDMTHGMSQPCLMDVKMALRTFTEEDAHSTVPRKDLLEKMVKVDPDAASEEELSAGGILKLRYLQFREQSTSTKTLGFRIDAVQLSDVFDTTDVPTPDELRLVATRDEVCQVISRYLQRRRDVLVSFMHQLRDLRSRLDTDEIFLTHSFIRSSLLLVYDGESGETHVRMIDLARVSASGKDTHGIPRRLDHRSAWSEGNHEDGYLTGLDNLIDIFTELLDAEL